jgi:putative transposase
MNGIWVKPRVRDEVVAFVEYWSKRGGIARVRLAGWVGVSRSKYYEWRRRAGCANRHNHSLARDHWLVDWERQAIVDYHDTHPLEGYRRLAYMMIDEDVVAVSPATVYRVLKAAGRMGAPRTPSSCVRGFEQPARCHEHWHIDVSYVNVASTFYYMCTVLDGCSRYVVQWDLLPAMTELDVEIVLQRAREAFPQTRPRIISDNGPQFLAREFKEYIRLSGMTHVRSSPYHPQSNGKIERYHGLIKSEAIRPRTPTTPEQARRTVEHYVEHYNTRRLHGAIAYVTPLAMLQGRQEQILESRREKLEQARKRRKASRQLTQPPKAATRSLRPEKRKRALEESNPPGIPGPGEQPEEEPIPNMGSSTDQQELVGAPHA